MPDKPKLRVISGGANDRFEGKYISTGIVTERGEEILRTTNDGSEPPGGGGAMKLTLPDLRWNVGILNGLAALFAVALMSMFLWMVDRIDDQFDRVQEPVQETAKAVAAQGATLDAINEKLGDVRTRMDKAEEAPPVTAPVPKQ